MKKKNKNENKGYCIDKAIKALEKAIAIPEPDISINLRNGCSEEQTRNLTFIINRLKEEYVNTFGVKPTIRVFFQ